MFNRDFRTVLGKFVFGAGLLVATGSLAYSQQSNPGVQQAGAVAANDCVKWGPGVGQIQTAGGPCAAGVTPAALTKADDTNVTLTLTGTAATSLLQAVQVAAGWTGTLSTARGGFGADVSAQSGIALNTAGVFSWLASSGTGNVARVNSAVFTTPNLGTPSAVTLTNGTGLPIDGGTINALPLTRLATIAANTVLANGTSGATVPTAFGMPTCSGASNVLQWLSNTGFQCATIASGGTVTSAQIIGAGLAVNSGTCTITTSGACTITTTAASAADQETGTSTTVAVVPNVQQRHPSAAKAWARCTGATGDTLSAGYNIAGGNCGRTGTGAYTLAFTTAFSSTAYVCTATAAGGGIITVGAHATGSITVASVLITTGGVVDNSFDIVCFGDQ